MLKIEVHPAYSIHVTENSGGRNYSRNSKVLCGANFLGITFTAACLGSSFHPFAVPSHSLVATGC